MNAYRESARLFQILSHPARLQILDVLRGGEECVCHLQSVLDKRQAFVSQQLMVLRDAGLVDSRREGLQVFYWLTNAEPALNDLLTRALGPVQERAHCTETACPHCQLDADGR
jgi:DNA-binding transcriptional ArsR family regulator